MDEKLFARIAPVALGSRADSTLRGERDGYNALARFAKPLDAPPNIDELIEFFETESNRVGRQSMRTRRNAASLLYRWLNLPNLTQNPLVRMYVNARMRQAKPSEPMDPMLDNDLEGAMRICELDDKPLRGLRDAALLSFLRHSAMRGSEVSALNFDADISLFDRSMSVRIRRSKSDQFSDGDTIWVQATADERFCPLAAMRRWREVFDGEHIFCGLKNNGLPRAVRLGLAGINSVVKKYMALLGHDPNDYGSHSGRSGYVTEGYRHGVSEADMLAVTRHKNVDILRKYRRFLPDVYENVARQLGL